MSLKLFVDESVFFLKIDWAGWGFRLGTEGLVVLGVGGERKTVLSPQKVGDSNGFINVAITKSFGAIPRSSLFPTLPFTCVTDWQLEEDEEEEADNCSSAEELELETDFRIETKEKGEEAIARSFWAWDYWGYVFSAVSRRSYAWYFPSPRTLIFWGKKKNIHFL